MMNEILFDLNPSLLDH